MTDVRGLSRSARLDNSASQPNGATRARPVRAELLPHSRRRDYPTVSGIRFLLVRHPVEVGRSSPRPTLVARSATVGLLDRPSLTWIRKATTGNSFPFSWSSHRSAPGKRSATASYVGASVRMSPEAWAWQPSRRVRHVADRCEILESTAPDVADVLLTATHLRRRQPVLPGCGVALGLQQRPARGGGSRPIAGARESGHEDGHHLVARDLSQHRLVAQEAPEAAA